MNPLLQAFDRLVGPDQPKLSWEQECVRALIVFVVGIAYIKAVGPRTFARGSPLDIVVSVVIGSNLSRALTGNAPLLQTLAATAVLVGLHWLFLKASHQWRWFSILVKGDPVDLVRDGKVIDKALDRHAITHHDLDEALREKGVEGAEGVHRAVLERGGQITVIRS